MAPHKIHRAAPVAIASLAALSLLSACGGSGTPAGSTNGSAGSVKVAAVTKGLDEPFFQTMQKGIEDGGKSAGVELTVQAANGAQDTTGQADKLTALGGQDYSCYVVNPIDGTNLVQAMATIAARKKTIVNIDSPVDPDAAKAANATPTVYIGTDNVDAGTKAGKQMAELLPDGGEIAFITGPIGQVTSDERVGGFKQAMGSKFTVVGETTANWQRNEGLDRATELIQAHPDIKAFFAANDTMGLGIATAVANAKKTGEIKIISVDGNKDAIDQVKSGGISAVIAQYPYTVGEMGINACKALAEGRTLPAKVQAPTSVITSANADQALGALPKPFEKVDDPTGLIGSGA